MAAQAVVAGSGHILFRHVQCRPEERVAPRLAHHAAAPGLVDRVGMAGAAGIGIDDLVDKVAGLCPGQHEIGIGDKGGGGRGRARKRRRRNGCGSAWRGFVANQFIDAAAVDVGDIEFAGIVLAKRGDRVGRVDHQLLVGRPGVARSRNAPNLAQAIVAKEVAAGEAGVGRTPIDIAARDGIALRVRIVELGGYEGDTVTALAAGIPVDSFQTLPGSSSQS